MDAQRPLQCHQDRQYGRSAGFDGASSWEVALSGDDVELQFV